MGILAVVLAGSTDSALAARPATRAEVSAIEHGARRFLPLGRPSISHRNVVVRACISTVEKGFAVAVVANAGATPVRQLVLFHWNPRLTPHWHPYAFGSRQNLWFAKQPSNPYETRLRAEHDLKDHCALRTGPTGS